jgi:PAS domain-containing protein
MTEDDLARHARALTGVAGWLLDGGTLALQWTTDAFHLHGLPPAAQAPSLDAVLQCIHPLDRDRVRHTWLSCLSLGRPCDLSYSVLSAGGTHRRLRCVAEFQGLPGGGGRLVGALHPLPDAPGQAFEASLEFAVAAAGVGVWEMDLVTGEERWSDQTLALYGLSPGTRAPTRAEWAAWLLHADDRSRVEERAADFRSTRRPYEMDYRIRRASDGALRWMHSRAAFAFGGERRVVGVTIDITEEREAEARAQEAMRLLEHAATQVGFGFGHRDPGGERGQWSVQMKRLFGLPDDAPTPDRSELGALICEHDRLRVVRELSTPMQPGELRVVEFDVLGGSTGSPRTLTTRAMTEHDAQGRPYRTYFAVMDVTA